MELIIELLSAVLVGSLATGLAVGMAYRLRRQPKSIIRLSNVSQGHDNIRVVSEKDSLRIYECLCHGSRMWRRVLSDSSEEPC